MYGWPESQSADDDDDDAAAAAADTALLNCIQD